MLRATRLLALKGSAVKAAARPQLQRQLRQLSIISDQSANIGDYPTNVPAVNKQTKSETVKYDNQQERRNFGETLHEEEDVMTVFSPDVHTHVTPGTAFLHIGIFITAFLGIVGLTKLTFEPLQADRRKYPYNGLDEELAGRAARS